MLTQAVRPSSAARDLPARERLIFALDVPSANKARQLVELLGDSVHFYKLGLQLFIARGYFELLNWLLEKEKKSLSTSSSTTFLKPSGSRYAS